VRVWKWDVDLESPGWMLVWGGMVGLFTGGVTVLYRFAVLEGNNAIWGGDMVLMNFGPVLMRFALPPLGGLVVGYFLYKVLLFSPGHGIPSVIHSVQTNQIRIPWRAAIPSAASVVILTTGGSTGPEGPLAEIGSVFGSNIGGWIGARQKTIRVLVGAGVAASIAAVFGAPIGGVFFALEVIFQGFEITLFGPVVIAAVIASMVSGAVFGYHTVVVFPAFTFNSIELPAYLGLGILTGMIAAFFIHAMDFSSRLFDKIAVPLWIKPALGGIGVGLIGIFLPRVIGEGYESLTQTFRGEVIARDLVFMLAGKILATGLTVGSGAPGGCFAPAIFIGGTLGGLYGALLERIFPDVVSNPSAYALIGMAGMIAGTFNAPMTAILVGLRVAEGGFEALLPLMTTVALALFIMSRWDHVSVYTLILRRHGKWFPSGYDRDPLLELTVAEVLVPKPKRLRDSLSVEEVLTEISGCEDAAFLVEGDHGEFRGIVSLNDLRLALADPVMGLLINLSDVVDPQLPRLSPTTNLREAVHLFSASKAEALPVFDAKGILVGLVTRDHLLGAYRNARFGSSVSVAGQ
jgi:chloride channel protein, CIC family